MDEIAGKTPVEICEFQLFADKLHIDFDKFKNLLSTILERPVNNNEMCGKKYEELQNEFLEKIGKKPEPTPEKEPSVIDDCVLYHGDCLEEMKRIPDGSVDLVLTDPPYGTTACKWDSIIPLDLMWVQLKRVIKSNGAIVLFSSEPFTSVLITTNLKRFKHNWIWKKSIPKGHLNAKKYPMKIHEIISVFSSKPPIYNPQFWESKPMNTVYKSGGNGRDSTYNSMDSVDSQEKNRTKRYPQDVLEFSDIPGNAKVRVHPTQKPVALMEYLIKTYTNEGDTVLDFTMGSGTTGVACVNLGRDFIGIEQDEKYFEIAKKRISEVRNG